MSLNRFTQDFLYRNNRDVGFQGRYSNNLDAVAPSPYLVLSKTKCHLPGDHMQLDL